MRGLQSQDRASLGGRRIDPSAALKFGADLLHRLDDMLDLLPRNIVELNGTNQIVDRPTDGPKLKRLTR